MSKSVNCISDEQLLETAFCQFLKRVARHLADRREAPLSPDANNWLKNAVHTLCSVFKKSSSSTRKRVSHYVAERPQFVTLTFKALCFALAAASEALIEPDGKALLPTYVSLALLIASSLQHQPKIADHIMQTSDELCKIVRFATKEQNGIDGEILIEMFLVFYFCAASSKVCELFVANGYVPMFGRLTQSSNAVLRLLSKAVIARLLPLDTSSDDKAVLILVDDDEAAQAISMLRAKVSTTCMDMPILPMLMDLCRSPHNIWAFVSQDATSVLSDLMDDMSEDEQAATAQLIWTCTEFTHEGSEEVSAVVNNGSLQQCSKCTEGDGNCEASYLTEVGLLSCIVEYMKEAISDSKELISNIFAAIALEHQLMEESGDSLRAERVLCVKNSPQHRKICIAIQSLLSSLCISKFKEIQGLQKITGIDVHKVVFEYILWLTSYSELLGSEISKSGAVTNLMNLLDIFVSCNVLNKVSLILRISINCALNMPAFNASYSSSPIIISALPFTHGQEFSLALCSKMLVALLNPLLSASQLLALKLNKEEARVLVYLLNQALESPFQIAQGISLLNVLRVMIWVCHQYSSTERSLPDDCSEFEKQLCHSSSELQINAELLLEGGLLPVLTKLLTSTDSVIQVIAARLVWCLAHNSNVKPQISNNSDIVSALQHLHDLDSSQELHLAAHCALWKLGLEDRDLLLYANGCLSYHGYEECIETCSKLVVESQEPDSQVLIKAEILQGKAIVYGYKRKMQSIILHKNLRTTKEGRIVLTECFESMKEAISLLGHGLDENCLDEEASKLLDWAMLDCLVKTNQLNLCHRCLLCRQRKDLKRSHIWPNFVAKSQTTSSDEKFVFGLDSYQLKTASMLTFWMLCERCECILSQNGEDEFNRNFPKSGSIKITQWLFSFCVGMVFRCLSMTVQFPMHFNDVDIYSVFLQCRRHLLSLPVKIRKALVPLNDSIKSQVDAIVPSHLEIYLFVSPLNTELDFGIFKYPYPETTFVFSRNKLLDRKDLFFNGHVHFLLLCCGPLTLIVNFDHDISSLEGKGFLLSSDRLGSDHSYFIPSAEEELVKLLPNGVWPILRQHTEGIMDLFSELSRFISKDAKLPPVQPNSSTPSSKHVVKMPASMKSSRDSTFLISYLPKGLEIHDPHVNLARNESILLPHGNQVILHGCLDLPPKNVVITLILCYGKPTPKFSSDILYLLFTHYNSAGVKYLYTDCVIADVRGGKLVTTSFVVQNPISMQKTQREELSQIQQMLDVVLPNKHFDNILLLNQLIKFRRCIKEEPLAKFLPSLDRKCSPKGCWYCRDLCHNCMQPGPNLYSALLEETPLKFCSNECKALWIHEPGQTEPFHIAHCSSETSDLDTVTVLVSKQNCVEQIYFSSEAVPNENPSPYVIWHKREVRRQFFSHFYISSDFLPLESFWPVQYSTAEIEIASNMIATDPAVFQNLLQTYLTKALTIESLTVLKSYESEPVIKKPNVQFYLPSGYAFCIPELGYAHYSIKIPTNELHSILIHWVDVSHPIHTTYLVVSTSVFTEEQAELYLIMIQHHLELGWYYVDGVYLSEDGSHATKFLLEAPHTRRSNSLSDVNSKLEKVLPSLLKDRGIPNFEILLSLEKYKWIDPLYTKLDQKCSSMKSCWFCKKFCLSCSLYITNSCYAPDFCSEQCYNMFKQDPSATQPVILNEQELSLLQNAHLKSENPTVISSVKKVISLDSNCSAILIIYVRKSPPGTLHAICQIKTLQMQEVIVCLLSEADYTLIGPMWPNEHSEKVFSEYKLLLKRELKLMYLP